jgi:hypothetical protein
MTDQLPKSEPTSPTQVNVEPTSPTQVNVGEPSPNQTVDDEGLRKSAGTQTGGPEQSPHESGPSDPAHAAETKRDVHSR